MTKHLILLQREQDEKELEKKIRVNLKIYQREPAVIEEPDVSEPESEEEEEQVESLPGTGVLKITKMKHGYWPSPETLHAAQMCPCFLVPDGCLDM